MLFNSYAFIFLFMPCLVVLYYFSLASLPQWCGIALLTISSFAFYAVGEVQGTVLLICSMSVNFVAATGMARNGRGRRTIFISSIIFNLVLLGWYKYSAFLVDAVDRVFGAAIAPPPVSLPAGISFFTFTQIAFLVDVYRREAKPYGLLRYSLFVSFFPHLIAGPIIHHSEMVPQFGTQRRSNFAYDLGVGLTVFSIGLFKKVMLADSLSPVVRQYFDAAPSALVPDSAASWLAALGYTFQIYFDFSGYSDMAIGLSRIFGIVLPLNFASPYKAVSISDFWRRWHITLSRFLRDYVYFPLGGNRRGEARRYANLFATMLLGGLWHGAGVTFIAWGALHGAFLVLERGWTRMSGVLGLRPVPRWAARPITFLAVVFAWVVFRAPDLASAVHTWQAMLDVRQLWAETSPVLAGLPFQLAGLADLPGHPAAMIAICAAIAWLAPNTQEIMAVAKIGLPSRGYPATFPVPATYWRWQHRPGFAAAAALLFSLSLLGLGRVSEFIYFRF